MNIIKEIKKYQKNMSDINRLDEAINDLSSIDVWKNNMNIRAKKLHDYFYENNDIINDIKNLIIDDADFASDLFDATRNMYYGDFDDPEVLIPLFTKCIEYYENKNSERLYDERLIILYGAMSYEMTEYVYRVSGEQKLVSEYHEKIYAMRDKFDEFTSDKSRYLYIVNYYNHLNSISDKKEYVDESAKYYLDLIKFLYEDGTLERYKDDEDLQELAYNTETTWLVVDDVIEYGNDNTKKLFYEASKKYYDIEMNNSNNDITEIDSQIYISYLHSLAMQGSISYSEAINKYLDYYNEKKKNMVIDDKIDDDDFYFLVNGPVSVEKLLHHLDSDNQKKIMTTLNRIVDNTWYSIVKAKTETPFVNTILAQWAENSIKYLDNRVDKERKLLNLVIKRQLPTYIHSCMVKNIAVLIFDSVYNKKPELFSGYDMSVIEMRDYIMRASILHDIGKTRICDIVSMVRRKLSDYEFMGIKNHPGYGAKIIENDPDLEIYRDIIIGHHKWYNGQGGYPSDFDNTKSKYRIFIDIITFADCLDAATDYLGRSYKNAKHVDDVIKEFIADKGTKYNPDIVDIISNDNELLETLRKITERERIDIMYAECIRDE